MLTVNERLFKTNKDKNPKALLRLEEKAGLFVCLFVWRQILKPEQSFFVSDQMGSLMLPSSLVSRVIRSCCEDTMEPAGLGPI